jgi:hypothetical protein
MNPGFSFTIDYDLFRLNLSPVSSMYNLSKESYVDHYFPLTSNMVFKLEYFLFNEEYLKPGKIKEFATGNAEFLIAESDIIDQINNWTMASSNGLIIGENKETIERYIKKYER